MSKFTYEFEIAGSELKMTAGPFKDPAGGPDFVVVTTYDRVEWVAGRRRICRGGLVRHKGESLGIATTSTAIGGIAVMARKRPLRRKLTHARYRA
jgi:hypothetical protein